jgi:hypothetical protein
MLQMTKKSNLPSFPGHGSSAEELQAAMGTEELVALPWPFLLNFVNALRNKSFKVYVYIREVETCCVRRLQHFIWSFTG